MKKLGIGFVLFAFFVFENADAQVDRAGQQKAPAVYSDDVSGSAAAIKEDRVKLEIDQIPDLVRLTLETEKRYLGWHDAQIFLNRSTGQYIFHITDSTNTTRTFTFNEEGKDLTSQVQEAAGEKSARRIKSRPSRQ